MKNRPIGREIFTDSPVGDGPDGAAIAECPIGHQFDGNGMG